MSPHLVELSFLRHAHAGDPLKWKGDDAARPLSAKGQEQAERLAHFLVDHGHRPDIIMSSPKLRAAQTARAVARPFDLEVQLDDRLAGPLDLAALDAMLGGLGGDARRVMLVGHDPDFSQLAGDLLGVDLAVRKGALVRIDAARPLTPGGGSLVWLVPPPLLDPG